jgi:hypothetical protein
MVVLVVRGVKIIIYIGIIRVRYERGAAYGGFYTAVRDRP